MIKYALICENAHAFESWFRDSASYDTQARRGFVMCPQCNSALVTKAIMAPAVRASRRRAVAPAPDAPPPGTAPVALLDERHRKLRAMMRELHKEIVSTADNVGTKFPDEARSMHEGGTPRRSIYGQASMEDVRELIEDGIDVMPMPGLADEQN